MAFCFIAIGSHGPFRRISGLKTSDTGGGGGGGDKEGGGEDHEMRIHDDTLQE